MIEHVRLRALAQAIVNKEKAAEAFDEYRNEAFPWITTQKKRDRQAHIDLLSQEVARGGLSIQAVREDKVRSRLKTRVVERTVDRDHKDLDSFYKKIGRIVPLR